jgi:hypothetical protein
MKTLLNALVINDASSLDINMSRPLSADRNGAMASKDSRAVAGNSVVKNILMFVAAPFIALGFIIALPAIGFYYIARFAIRALSKRLASSSAGVKRAAAAIKNVALFFASPFIALAYVIALPFVGFFMIAKLALEAREKGRLHHA